MKELFAAQLMVLAILLSSPQEQAQLAVNGETIVVADAGELISIAPPDMADCRCEWMIVAPVDFEQYQVGPQSRSLYLSMPARDVRIALVVAPNDVDQRIEIRRYRIRYSGADPGPGPDPEPEPDPAPDDYNGPDEYGVGSVAWQVSKGRPPSEIRQAAQLIRKAMGHLRGDGGLKFIDSEDGDDNIFSWLAVNGSQWMTPVFTQMRTHKGLTLGQWMDVFEEAAIAWETRS